VEIGKREIEKTFGFTAKKILKTNGYLEFYYFCALENSKQWE
jgi:hypothetical protein